MAFDLAIDYNSGDLLVASNKDLDVRSGKSVIEQRMRVRLRIHQGEWILDDTGGTLGSTLHDAQRMPVYRAIGEIPLMIEEALHSMDDISVQNVLVAQNPDDSRTVDTTIYYLVLAEGEDADLQSLTFTSTVAG